MAKSDLETLVVSLEANLKNYLQGMAKAQNTTIASIKKMEQTTATGMARVEKSFAKAGTALAGFGKGLAIGAIVGAVAGLEQLVTGAVSSAAAIGDLSDKLGINSDKLQELQFGAVQANMSFDELETSLLKFSKTLGQARNGQGDLLKTLEANGFDKAKIQALSYSEALDTVADLVKNAANEQDALLIITQAFGKGGDEMLEFLRNGAGGLKDFGNAAHEAGAIIDAELIDSAQRFDDAWAAAALSAKAHIGNFVLDSVSNVQKLWNLLSNPPKSGLGFIRLMGGGSMEEPAAASPLTQSGPGKGSLNPTKIFDPQAAKADADAFTKAQQQKSDAIKRLIDFSIEQQHRAADAAEEQLKLDRELYDSKVALAESALDAFEAIAIGGEKASDVIKNLASSLLKAALQASLFGSGPLASLFGSSAGGGFFGSLFGKPAGRASGGHVNAGEPYMVGERGRELFVPSQSGSIMPRVGGGGFKVIINDNVGASVGTRERQGANGEKQLIVMIDNRISRQMSDPYSSASPALSARGAKAPMKRR